MLINKISFFLFLLVLSLPGCSVKAIITIYNEQLTWLIFFKFYWDKFTWKFDRAHVYNHIRLGWLYIFTLLRHFKVFSFLLCYFGCLYFSGMFPLYLCLQIYWYIIVVKVFDNYLIGLCIILGISQFSIWVT